MRPVRFHDAARLELVNEVLYYVAVSPRLGERLAKAVEDAIGLAQEFPEAGPPYACSVQAQTELLALARA